MAKNKKVEVVRVSWPEYEKTFPSENRRVQKQFVGVMPLDKLGISKNEEENMDMRKSQGKIESMPKAVIEAEPLDEVGISKNEEENMDMGESQGREENIKLMEPKDLKHIGPFSDLFSIDQEILDKICEDMKIHGYDNSQPVVVWKGKGIVIDGHTRVDAALQLGIKQIPVCEKDFPDEEEALNYAVHCQVNRRNLPDSEIFRLVQVMDERRKVGRPSKEITANEGNKRDLRLILERLKNRKFEKEFRRSSKITASLLKTSPTKVEKVRTVLDKAEEKIKAAVLAGEITIHKAYVETLKKPKSYILRFGRDGLRATLTLSKDLGEVKWITLGFGEQPNLTLDPESSKILQPKIEKFE